MSDKTPYVTRRKNMTFIQQCFGRLKPILIAAFVLMSLDGCFGPDVNKPLKRTYWGLTEINGNDTENVSSQPEVHLVFHANDNTFHGSDGCNRIQGSYTQEEESFKFERIASTKMYCEHGMDQADAFMQVLTKTMRIKIEEDHLILYTADIELARFEANDAY